MHGSERTQITMTPPTLLPRLSILLAALLFSTGGAAIKSCQLSGWQVACFRSLVAALALWILLPNARKHWSIRTFAVGAAYGATMVLFVLANKLTTAANTIFLQSTAPLYILLCAPFLLKERISRRDIALMLVISAGLALFFIQIEPATASAPRPGLGNLLSVLAGVAYALTLMGLRWLERPAPSSSKDPLPTAQNDQRGAGLAAVVAGNLMAALISLPFAFSAPLGTTADWLILVYLGMIQIALAYVFLTFGFRYVAAFEGSLLILLEPTLSPVWAFLIHGEIPSNLALLGGAIILFASIAKTFAERRVARAPH